MQQLNIFDEIAASPKKPAKRLKQAHEIIPTVWSNQSLLIAAIVKLHNKGQRLDLDPCYNKGTMYGDFVERPKQIFDIAPIKGSGASQADARDLPIKDNSVQSIVFDPPFIIDSTTGKMAKRFTAFKSIEEMVKMYDESLKEFYRVLKRGGIVIFKCQDMINGRTQYFLHCIVQQLASKNKLYSKDLFIFVNNTRLIAPTVNQCHARKFHTYFWVFQKRKFSQKQNFFI